MATVKHENHLDETEPRWFAVHTKFKSEKVALKQIAMQGVEAYLPIREVTRKYQRKIKKIELPLISSFVFVRIVKKQYILVLEAEYTAGFRHFQLFSRSGNGLS